MDKLRAMELFVRIVEAGSFTRAAASLGMPKASAATLIQKLEANLGVRLLNRTTRRVAPTPDGAAYYERCVSLLAQLRETEEALAGQHAVPQGRVRVEVPALMARAVIAPALPTLLTRYPRLELALSVAEGRADLVEEGIDCAVWAGELPDSRLVARRVGALYVATCAAPSYLAEHGAPQHPAELVKHRCLRTLPAGGRATEWVFSRGAERVQLVPAGPLAIDDAHAYVAAAEAGAGIAQVPAFILKDAMDRGTLDVVLSDWLAEPVPLHVVWPQQRQLSPRVRAFVDWLATLLSEHDGIQLRSTVPRISATPAGRSPAGTPRARASTSAARGR